MKIVSLTPELLEAVSQLVENELEISQDILNNRDYECDEDPNASKAAYEASVLNMRAIQEALSLAKSVD